MMTHRVLCPYIAAILSLAILLLPLPAHADVKEIIAEGTYIMGDGETPSVAQERAVEEAKRSAVRQAGTYLESITEVSNLSLSKDEIRSFASGIVETTVIDKKRSFASNDAIQFWVKVRCTVNTDNIQAMKSKLQDRTAMDTLKKIQSDYDNAMQEITVLKQQLAQATSAETKKQVEEKIVKNEQSFSATQWFDKGYDYQINKKDYNNALPAYNKAIQLNPQLAEAYNNRGILYNEKHQYDAALSDFTMSIQLNPQYGYAFNNRGNLYKEKRQYDLALADYNTAIQLNPQYEALYYNRGNLYGLKGRYDLAVADFATAVEIDPQFANAYLNQAVALMLLKRNQEAIQALTLFLQCAPANHPQMEMARSTLIQLRGTR